MSGHRVGVVVHFHDHRAKLNVTAVIAQFRLTINLLLLLLLLLHVGHVLHRRYFNV